MKNRVQKTFIIALSVAALSLGSVQFAQAHVTVKPAEVVTAGFQTFTVSVPNEKTISTTAVKLAVPEGLKYVTPTVKNGWKITVEKSGNGEDARVTEINWSDGLISDGLRDEFTFGAQVPESSTELKWKAYQTYSDGTVVSWDQESHGNDHDSEDKNSGPLSITKVVAETEATASQNSANQAAMDAKIAADRALYASIAAILVGLIAVVFATRKKQ